MLVAFFSADESFIPFDGATQRFHITAASLTQASQNEPRGFLSHADFLGQLHGGDALSGRDKQVHGVDPLV
jgi:hypothetical protein